MTKHIHIHTAALLKPRVKAKDGQKPYLSLNTRYQEWEVLNSENKVARTFPKSERAKAQQWLQKNYAKLERGFVEDGTDDAMAPADKAALQKLVAEIRNTLAHVSGDINAGSISPQTRSSARTLKMSVATLASDIESFRD